MSSWRPNLRKDSIEHVVDTKHSLGESQPNGTDMGEFFDPDLVPQSTLAYESKGARIETLEILTLSGERVNCLKRGKTYRYSYKVHFDKGVTNVRFGMLIKSISGVELGGGASAPTISQAISYIAPDTEAHIELRFTAALNPGTYFVNAGVVGSVGNEETYLHRILDACMFRILPVTDNLDTGAVFLDVEPQVIFNRHITVKPAQASQ